MAPAWTCGFINSCTPNPQVSTPSQTTGGDDSSTSMNSVVLSVAGFSVLVVFTNLFSLIVGAFLMNRWMFRSKKDDKIKGTESAVEFMKQKNTMQHGNEESPPMVDSIPVTNPEL